MQEPTRRPKAVQLPWLHRQPWKALYIASSLMINIVLSPLMVVYYSFPKNRPRSRWTLTRCLIVWWIRSTMVLPLKTGLSMGRDVALPLIRALERCAKRVWIDGIPQGSMDEELSHLAKENSVQPTTVAAFWHGSGTSGEYMQDGEVVVLHMHGGAMVLGFAFPPDEISRGLRTYCDGRIKSVLSLDYRLSSSTPLVSNNPFPASLLDAIAAYRYLVQECQIPPERILISGVSAGGALAVGLVRHILALASPELKPPMALFLSSPWVDLSDSHLLDDPSCSIVSNANCDIWSAYTYKDQVLSTSPLASFINYAKTSYIGSMDPDTMRDNPFISPASLDLKSPEGLFAGFPRTYIVCGGAEASRDSIRTLKRRITADTSEENEDTEWVILDEYEDAIHGFLAFRFHSPERGEAFKRFNNWLSTVVNS